MTKEIKTQPTADGPAVAVPSNPQGHTGDVRWGAERNDKKPTVSWAALLDEAVSKPGYIHQAYSRFHNYSLGNHWGDIDAHDQAENEFSLTHGFRLLSSYRTAAGDTVWAIAEADRSATTLLLPEEY